ncbi:MAG: L28 family ribosomal protein [Patescibacteria group bacterium]|jgi:ribosomal protein L28
MSKFCDACGRGALTINLRSKSENAVKSKQQVNLQTAKIDGKRVSICTRCMKTMAKKPGLIKITPRKVRLAGRKTKQSAK